MCAGGRTRAIRQERNRGKFTPMRQCPSKLLGAKFQIARFGDHFAERACERIGSRYKHRIIFAVIVIRIIAARQI